jgi:hypothetical protein
MGLQTHKWLPDGPSLKIPLKVTSAPVYIPGRSYKVRHFINAGSEIFEDNVIADSKGRITLDFGPGDYETAIYEHGDKPEPAVLSYDLTEDKRLLETGENDLVVKLCNRGGDFVPGEILDVHIQTDDRDIVLYGNELTLTPEAESRILTLPPVKVSCTKNPPMHGEPSQIRFRVYMNYGGKEYSDELIVPVLFNAPSFDSIRIDDGRNIRTRSYGSGNADGMADAGEKIMIYQGLHRLRLYTNDPWVIRDEEELVDEQIPAIWEDGYALSSVIAISNECPDGHIIELTGDYETNSFNPVERKLHWGTVKIKVSNSK